jgi:hypothetical protein
LTLSSARIIAIGLWREITHGTHTEKRIRYIEDRLEIYNLIAARPPTADAGAKDLALTIWVEDGVSDRGPVFWAQRDAMRRTLGTSACPSHCPASRSIPA